MGCGTCSSRGAVAGLTLTLTQTLIGVGLVVLSELSQVILEDVQREVCKFLFLAAGVGVGVTIGARVGVGVGL